ncbi:MAG: archaemetzincin family Zn-dependent metalloprotease [Marinilabiliales bacterium]|nr:archaemetzincin family Zn-dependent metalloprotease [Marinilabiliales bacterium]
MKFEKINLISFGFFEKSLLEKISADVERAFELPIWTREGHLDLSHYYDPNRRQYDGYALLKKVDADFGQAGEKTLGIFNVDLFIPILTFIFGQAYLNGRAGIASIYRLRNEKYGIFKDENILIQRFKKEVIHELGHTFGLIHCIDPECVMRSSTYVEDIDQKSQHLCKKCREKLESDRML